MHKQKAVLLILLFCSCVSGRLLSQITATSGPITACAPANVTYTAPSGATNILWTFSGAFPPSNTATGGNNVLTPTSFTAVFTGTVGGNPLTFSVPVTVFARPTASFTIAQPSNACVVKTVTFTNLSTSGVAITGYVWTYGDGGGSTNSNTLHTYGYTIPGTFSASLKVTDANGCDNQVSVGPINVINAPTAVITSNPPLLTGCSSTFSAVFSASNSTGSGLSYNWNFGNSQTSQLQTAGPITFTAQPAQYLVTLTVTSSGCSASVSTYVTVSPPTLSVTVPATICLNAPTTVTINSNQPYTTWNLGNSNLVSIATPPPNNPVTTIPAYTATGTYVFTVTAGSVPCVATPVVQSVVVSQVVAGFTANPPLVSCSPTFAVSYLNQSSPNATQFQWYFSTPLNNATSNLANPTFTFSYGSLNPYTIYGVSYAPSVTLIATSAAGCTAAVTHTFHTIERPTASFVKNKKEGCAPLVVTYTDNSFAFASAPITSYTWCNGATPATSVSGTASPPVPPGVIPQQIFTYNTPGVFFPYLIVKTNAGCIDTSFFDTVTVATPPTISFNFSPSQACAGQLIQITNTSPNASAVQHWHVESDNGYFSGCVSNPNPGWKFTHVGQHGFTMYGYKNGCMGQTTLTQSVTIKGPIVQSRFETKCTNRKSVDFFSVLQEAHTATLNFGDLNQVVIAGNGNPGAVVSHSVTHTYTAAGNYTATLTGTNTVTGCPVSIDTLIVTVRDVKADFSLPGIGCVGVSVLFNASASIDVLTGCSRGYVWDPLESTCRHASLSIL